MVENKRRTYLIQDPYDEDAIDFIRTISIYFGLRPVCLYTDEKARFYGEKQFPILSGDLIEEAVNIGRRDIHDLCRELQQRYDILAVIPYREDTVELAADLCEILDLDWNDRETLLRFRDKTELKRYVTEQDPGVRVPAYRIVRTVDDVWADPPVPGRFVIKPNDGLGNQRIGIFDSSERDAIAEHVRSDPPTTWILEEFIEGPEYHVNGQVRSNGEVMIIAIFLYTRIATNGYETVYSGEQQVLTTDPNFDEILAYSTRLLEATGLRRCPFHLEVKVDADGPCLIDLGARYGSDGGALTFSRVHPERPDAFAVAAHDYLGENDFAMDPVDFTYYDRERTATSYGVAETGGRIRSLHGIDEIEAMPEFVKWIVKPVVGQDLGETRELRDAPFIVEMRHSGSQADSDRLIEFAQKTIRWSLDDGRVAAARVDARELVDRGRAKLEWIAASRLR